MLKTKNKGTVPDFMGVADIEETPTGISIISEFFTLVSMGETFIEREDLHQV